MQRGPPPIPTLVVVVSVRTSAALEAERSGGVWIGTRFQEEKHNLAMSIEAGLCCSKVSFTHTPRAALHLLHRLCLQAGTLCSGVSWSPAGTLTDTPGRPKRKRTIVA